MKMGGVKIRASSTW